MDNKKETLGVVNIEETPISEGKTLKELQDIALKSYIKYIDEKNKVILGSIISGASILTGLTLSLVGGSGVPLLIGALSAASGGVLAVGSVQNLAFSKEKYEENFDLYYKLKKQQEVTNDNEIGGKSK